MGIASNEVIGGQAGENGATRRLCTHRTKAGRLCGAPCVKGFEACYMHAPELADQRRESQKRGGLTTHGRRMLLLGRLRISDGMQIREARVALMAAVIQGSIVPARATVVAALLRDAEAGLPRAQLEAQIGELSETLADLEAENARA